MHASSFGRHDDRDAQGQMELVAVRAAIDAMGSSLEQHIPVIEVFLQEAGRWAHELESFDPSGGAANGAAANLRSCLHEIANGMAIAGAASCARAVRQLEHEVQTDGCDTAMLAAQARHVLNRAVTVLHTAATLSVE
jgi:hypothetical protein